MFPYDPANPLGHPSLTKYPVDKDNIAPRLGFVWNPDGESKSVVRAGYGHLLRQDAAGHGRQLPDRLQVFAVVHRELPGVGPDLGPRNGQFPTEPMLLVNQLEPAHAGAARDHQLALSAGIDRPQHGGTVSWDDPESPAAVLPSDQRRLRARIFRGVSASVDYVRMNGRDMFFNPNLNIALGTNDERDGPRQDPDPIRSAS